MQSGRAALSYLFSSYMDDVVVLWGSCLWHSAVLRKGVHLAPRINALYLLTSPLIYIILMCSQRRRKESQQKDSPRVPQGSSQDRLSSRTLALGAWPVLRVAPGVQELLRLPCPFK